MDSSQIHEWLESLYNKNVPIQTNQTYKLLDYLKKQNYDSIPLIDYILTNKVEFDLSKECQQRIDTLAYWATSLGMGSTQLHNYYSAISKLSTDKLEYQQELEKLTDIENYIDASMASSADELNTIQRILEQLEETQSNELFVQKIHETRMQERKKIDQLFKQESHNYIDLKARYSDIERKGVKVEDLILLEDKINLLESTIEEKNRHLKSFQGLPSDMVLASLQIKQTQEELHELEQERENLISDIANSVH